jgi:hypothetical protein
MAHTEIVCEILYVKKQNKIKFLGGIIFIHAII